MSEMIERVARAIGKVEGYDLPNDLTLPHASGSRVGRTLAMARAAIEEMRTPTEGMVDAGRNLQHPAHIYAAMIDAALEVAE